MLKQKLAELLGAMTGGPTQPPVPVHIVIAELGPDQFDALGRAVVVVADLCTPEQYESRFDALMAKGYSWLNLTYGGLLDGKGLVLVEVPRGVPNRSGATTSVNVSGPPSHSMASGWDARSHVVVL